MSLLDEPLAGFGDTLLRLVRAGQAVQLDAITILVDEDGTLPPVDSQPTTSMLTVAADAKAPWVSSPPGNCAGSSNGRPPRARLPFASALESSR